MKTFVALLSLGLLAALPGCRNGWNCCKREPKQCEHTCHEKKQCHKGCHRKNCRGCKSCPQAKVVEPKEKPYALEDQDHLYLKN